MRLVKVKRRSTAHYRRRLPPDTEWTGPAVTLSNHPHAGRGAHLARMYDRRAQLDSIETEWMQRTLERVTIDGEWDEARRRRMAALPPAEMNSHQLQQMKRDRIIQERRGRHRPGNDPMRASAQSPAGDSLRVKGMMTSSRSSNCGGGGSRPQSPTPSLPAPRLPPRGRRQPPPPQAPLPPLVKQQQRQQQQQLRLSRVDDNASSPLQQQQQQHRQRPRRLGGGGGIGGSRIGGNHRSLDSASDLQYLRITGPVAAHGVRWPTPVGLSTEPDDYHSLHHLQQQQRRGAHNPADISSSSQQLDKEQTLVQPRNPVNSPELVEGEDSA